MAIQSARTDDPRARQGRWPLLRRGRSFKTHPHLDLPQGDKDFLAFVRQSVASTWVQWCFEKVNKKTTSNYASLSLRSTLEAAQQERSASAKTCSFLLKMFICVRASVGNAGLNWPAVRCFSLRWARDCMFDNRKNRGIIFWISPPHLLQRLQVIYGCRTITSKCFKVTEQEQVKTFHLLRCRTLFRWSGDCLLDITEIIRNVPSLYCPVSWYLLIREENSLSGY